MSALKREAVTLLRLELAPHQIVKTLKVYVYPKVEYAYAAKCAILAVRRNARGSPERDDAYFKGYNDDKVVM
ncbi:hypothetical protein ATCC90586_011593 [Pythium insidiosum]|nr:hypothetical protein ATCC90586_011593 [Pythium insidiosum]